MAETRHTGRPRSTTRQQDRFVVLRSLKRMRSWHHENNILSRRRPAVRRPWSRCAVFLAWSQHLAWICNSRLGCLLFTAESRFTLSFIYCGRLRVWRRQREWMHVWAYDHYSDGSLMVRGSLGLMWTTEHSCTVSKGISPGTGYRDDILLPLVLPALQAIGQGAVLQQRPSQCNLCWYRLPAEVARHPDGLASTITLSQSHKTFLGCAWATNASHPPTTLWPQPDVLRFCQETLRRLVKSMRPRCLDCIQANGGHTRFWLCSVVMVIFQTL